jgi:predicted PurR-regulated permease PerM
MSVDEVREARGGDRARPAGEHGSPPLAPSHGPGPAADHERPVELPYALRTAAEWAWRVVIVGILVYFILRGLSMFEVVVVPLLVALLIVALVRPIFVALSGRGRLPRSPAALLTILFSLLVIAGLISLISQQIATGFPSLQRDASQGLDQLQDWLRTGPFHVSTDQFDEWLDRARSSVQENSDTLVSGALAFTSTAGHVLTGFFLVLFSTYFFLSGGDRIWAWLVRLFPRGARARVDGAGVRAWATLTSFVRATLIVAFVDGAGVAVGAAVLGVPLAIPLGVVVFLGAFVPIVGALVSGSVAVLVAFVAVGPVKALLMLAVVIVVQQVEAHVLQPFLLGRAVSVHPLAVIIAIAMGVLLAGIVGALFAVPFVAVLNVVVSYLANADENGDLPPDETADDSGPLADDTADDERLVAENAGPGAPGSAPTGPTAPTGLADGGDTVTR